MVPPALLALSLTVAVAGCGATGTNESSVAQLHGAEDGYAGTLVQDPPLQVADVILRDTTGEPFDLGELPGDRVTAIFFGFTHCPDVCPTTLVDLAGAKAQLSANQADRVDIVFITVDPRRDTPRVLDRWVGRFDQTIIGLRGPAEVVHAAERSLYSEESAIRRDSAQRAPGDRHDHQSQEKRDAYDVTHSGAVYLFGPQDRSVLYSTTATPDEYAQDMARLL